MLVAQYSESDAYLSQEDYDELDEEDQENTEPGEYQEHIDEMYYSDFKWEVKEAFSKRKFPLMLIARRSNWQRQDGYAKCTDIEDVLGKVSSFDSGSVELHRTKGSALHFAMGGTHDVPTGFTIDVRPINKSGD